MINYSIENNWKYTYIILLYWQRKYFVHQSVEYEKGKNYNYYYFFFERISFFSGGIASGICAEGYGVNIIRIIVPM